MSNSNEKSDLNNPIEGTISLFVEEPKIEYKQIIEYQGITINGAIKDYYSCSTNREKVFVLKWIVNQPQFVELKQFTEDENKVYTLNESEYDSILKTSEMPNNLQIAQKFVKNKYDVFLLSNPSNTKSADFIIRRNGNLYYVEGKTFVGNNSLDHLLEKGCFQSERIVVNVLGNKNVSYLSKVIKQSFEQHRNLKELFLLKKMRMICITRMMVLSKNFMKEFKIVWTKNK